MGKKFDLAMLKLTGLLGLKSAETRGVRYLEKYVLLQMFPVEPGTAKLRAKRAANLVQD